MSDWRAAGLLVIALAACGGGEAEPDAVPIQQAQVQRPEKPPEPPRFVLVHRNTRIYLSPDENAPYLQYREPERQAEFDERRAAAEAERLEKEKEAEAERREKEKERRDKLRKRRRKYSSKKRRELAERDKERAEERRIQRAQKELRDARRRAAKDRIEAPDRWWIPFLRVAERDDWLELRPVPRGVEPPHCFQGNFGELDRLDATFWVKKADVAPVVSRRVRVPVYSGTEVILLPGVALAPHNDETGERYRAYVDGFVLDLDVPSDAVGDWYRPDTPFEAPITDTVFTEIAFAEQKLRFGKSTRFPYNPYRDLYVTGTLRIDSKFYVTTQTPCGEYTVRAAEDLVEPAGRRGATRLTGDSTRVDPPYAKRGAVAHSADGKQFGRALVDFPLGDHTQDKDGRSCWRTAVWGKTDAAVQRAVELCFDPKELVLGEES